MELVYLWVENYKNIHHQGFNFSPRFHCEYNHEANELSITENDDYIPNFFGKNINITAIVGKNGSGKSSLLNAIVNSSENFFLEETDFILVFNDTINNYYTSNFSVKANLNKCKNSDYKRSLIFYGDREDNDKFINIDNLNKYNKKSSEQAFRYYRKMDVSKETIVKLIAVEIGKIDSSFQLSTFMYLPNQISMKLKTKEELIDRNITFFTKDRGEVKDIYFKIYDIEHHILFIEYGRKFGINVDIKILSNKEKLKIILKDSENKRKKVLKLIKETIFNISDLTEEEKDAYIRKNGYLDYLNIDLKDSKNRRYNNLSHGEKTIFGQLLNVYFYTFKKDNICFLFDEPEISLHPSWQKRYIYEVLNLLKKVDGLNHLIFTSHSPFLLSDIPKQNIIFLDSYKKEDKEVKHGEQKIGNCKVLSHDEVLSKKQTFGANIHTLLSDSFFMKDGLMGEFAKGKINEIIDFHKEVEENKKEKANCFSLRIRYIRLKLKFWQVQSIIGEEYLKQVVKNHLRDIENILLGHDEAREEEIKRLLDEAYRLGKM